MGMRITGLKSMLGRIPAVTDQFEVAGYRFEVVDMDKNRVDKMLLTRLMEAGVGDESAVA